MKPETDAAKGGYIEESVGRPFISVRAYVVSPPPLRALVAVSTQQHQSACGPGAASLLPAGPMMLPPPPPSHLPLAVSAISSSPFSWFSSSGGVAAGPTTDRHKPWSSLFATKTILIVGGSTGRQMLDAFVGHAATLAEKQNLMTARCKSFNVMDDRFAGVVRGWSKRVHNCTSVVAEEAGIACSDCHQKCLMPSEKKPDGWTDVSVTRMINTSLGPARGAVPPACLYSVLPSVASSVAS